MSFPVRFTTPMPSTLFNMCSASIRPLFWEWGRSICVMSPVMIILVFHPIHGGQDGDDRDDHQEFNEGEGLFHGYSLFERTKTKLKINIIIVKKVSNFKYGHKKPRKTKLTNGLSGKITVHRVKLVGRSNHDWNRLGAPGLPCRANFATHPAVASHPRMELVIGECLHMPVRHQEVGLASMADVG